LYAGLLAVEDGVTDGHVGIAMALLQGRLDVDARYGIASATQGRGAKNRRRALTFRYSGTRNQR
jgi:hypothetical protein